MEVIDGPVIVRTLALCAIVSFVAYYLGKKRTEWEIYYRQLWEEENGPKNNTGIQERNNDSGGRLAGSPEKRTDGGN